MLKFVQRDFTFWLFRIVDEWIQIVLQWASMALRHCSVYFGNSPAEWAALLFHHFSSNHILCSHMFVSLLKIACGSIY